MLSFFFHFMHYLLLLVTGDEGHPADGNDVHVFLVL